MKTSSWDIHFGQVFDRTGQFGGYEIRVVQDGRTIFSGTKDDYETCLAIAIGYRPAMKPTPIRNGKRK